MAQPTPVRVAGPARASGAISTHRDVPRTQGVSFLPHWSSAGQIYARPCDTSLAVELVSSATSN